MKTKEKIKDLKNQVKIAEQLGHEKGLNLVLNKYDKYRKFAYWVLLLGMCLMFIFKFWWQAFFMFCLWHIHTFLNQIWWKLVNFEENYIKKHEEENTD